MGHSVFFKRKGPKPWEMRPSSHPVQLVTGRRDSRLLVSDCSERHIPGGDPRPGEEGIYKCAGKFLLSLRGFAGIFFSFPGDLWPGMPIFLVLGLPGTVLVCAQGLPLGLGQSHRPGASLAVWDGELWLQIRSAGHLSWPAPLLSPTQSA